MKTILVDAVNALVLKDEGMFEEMLQILEEYPNKKIVLTGANDEEAKKFGLSGIPYELFTLKHNPEKTDPLYYENLLEHYGLNNSEVIYFEHNIDAVKSAQSVGINTYYYDKEAKDLVALKKFIDDNL
jgi:HAD superfamily hydrolase (TIGR01509 family)